MSACPPEPLILKGLPALEANRRSRIGAQPCVADRRPALDAQTIASIDQTILRVVQLAQPKLERSPMTPLHLLVGVVPGFAFVNAGGIVTQ